MLPMMMMMMGMIKGDEERAECIMWSHLENKTMPLQDQGHATCRTNDECSGFSCKGTFKVVIDIINDKSDTKSNNNFSGQSSDVWHEGASLSGTSRTGIIWTCSSIQCQ